MNVKNDLMLSRNASLGFAGAISPAWGAAVWARREPHQQRPAARCHSIEILQHRSPHPQTVGAAACVKEAGYHGQGKVCLDHADGQKEVHCEDGAADGTKVRATAPSVCSNDGSTGTGGDPAQDGGGEVRTASTFRVDAQRFDDESDDAGQHGVVRGPLMGDEGLQQKSQVLMI